MSNFLANSLSNWLKETLLEGILIQTDNVSDVLYSRIEGYSELVSLTLASLNTSFFSLVINLSETLIMPIAGVILTFVCVWELIQLLVEQNNLVNLDSWIFFKWLFKTAIAVTLLSNCYNITLAVFDVASSIVQSSTNIITSETALTLTTQEDFEAILGEKGVMELFAIWIQMIVLRYVVWALYIAVWVIIWGRMIEIYMMVSLSPIPFATFGNREQSQIGQNFLRSLIALGLQ